MIPLSALLYHRFVLRGLQWAFAAVFLYAGWVKLGSPQEFSDSIASFALLPNSLVGPLALALPPFEIVLGLGIVLGIQRRAALLGSVLLTVVFMLALASAIVRGIPVNCGCFGSSPGTKAEIDLARDAVLLAVGVMLYWRETRE